VRRLAYALHQPTRCAALSLPPCSQSQRSANPIRRSVSEPRVSIAWGDSKFKNAVSFSLSVRAVDRAGNLGPPSDPIVFEDDGGGSSVGGCSAGAGSTGLPIELCVLALGLARRWRGATK
jgi:hypothetical protein